MKRSQRKDFIRELRHSLNRYLSIMAIMALGVAFYAGVRSAEPDMKLLANQFFNAQDYMDLRVIGTMGLTQEDAAAIESMEAIACAEGAYEAEVYLEAEQRVFQLKLYTLTEQVNRAKLTKGRMPESSDECLMDEYFMELAGYQLGDTITLSTEEQGKIADILHEESYTIVGAGVYPEYLSWERGTVSIGTGTADGFLILPKEAFSCSAYTTIYARTEDTGQLDCYGSTYEERLTQIKEEVRKTGEERCELLLEEMRASLPAAVAEQIKPDTLRWFVLGRDTVPSIVEYGMDAERIGKIGKVFPAVFYLVAALVSLTTMTRMIEEERTQIGTMKALGYGKGSIAAKYLWYSLSAALIGSLAGVLLGSRVLPLVIIKAYKILYTHLPEPVTPIQMPIALISVGIALFCTVAATLSACYRELAAVPSVLMRPAAPKEGKRVFLEHITFLWRLLSFSWKATFRNLFRYKKRLFMTIFGIGGCMALLMVGFGLRDSISEIVNNQYKKLWTYDAQLTVKNTEVSLDSDTVAPWIGNQLPTLQKTIDLESVNAQKSAELFVPERLEDLEEFLTLTSRKNNEIRYELTAEGVILSEKLAHMLKVGVGDSVRLKRGEGEYVTVSVTAIVENYLHHYVYMSPELYCRLFQEKPACNRIFLKLLPMTQKQKSAFSKELMSQENIDAVSYVEDLQEHVDKMMESLDFVVIVLIVAAALLAFIVLYNLNNINILERRRELATIRVLGFYDTELAMYVYRENILLTVLGILFGTILGIFLHRFVIITCEIDMIMFGRSISWFSYAASVACTLLFSALVNAGMFRKLRAIDMVESLKNME